MTKMNDELNIVQNLIHEIRGMKVMLDFDLARLYQVETKVLKQAVRRNIERFPADFMFTLSQEEYNELKINIRSQFVTFNDGRAASPLTLASISNNIRRTVCHTERMRAYFHCKNIINYNNCYDN